MDVKNYVALARRAVAEIEDRGRRALVVGGSGFYLRSFFAPVADDVPVDEKVRADLQNRLERDGLKPLVAELERLNPGGLGGLDRKNPRRVLRALERCMISGRTLRELADAFAGQPPPFSDRMIRVVVLERGDADLRARIERRTTAMFAQGLVDEVRLLRRKALEKNPSASSAIGYREVLAWIDSGGSADELGAEINRNTWRLVRKQRTWFRTQLPAHRTVVLRDRAAMEITDLYAFDA
jgi:tRNA dimethylallyltransferase